jgi:hypothetical protein
MEKIDLFFFYMDQCNLKYDTIKKYFPDVAEEFDLYLEEMNKQYMQQMYTDPE